MKITFDIDEKLANMALEKLSLETDESHFLEDHSELGNLAWELINRYVHPEKEPFFLYK